MTKKHRLFKGTIRCGLLKNLIKASKSTNPVLTILVSDSKKEPMRFWCRHPTGRVAMTGVVGDGAFADLDMDMERDPVAFVVQGKQVEDVLGMMNAKAMVTMEVLDDGQKLTLAFSHVVRDAPERVEFEVEEAVDDDVPYDEDLETRDVTLVHEASASVDLKLLTKYVKSIMPAASGSRGSTTFTFRVDDDAVVVEAHTRDGADTWRHPTDANRGTGSVLLETKMFHSVANGANFVGPTGTVHIMDRCVRIVVVNGHVQACYYLGTAEVML